MMNLKNKDKWTKLEQYLSDLRFHTAPNAHTPDGVRYDRLLQIEVIDRIINHMHVLDKEEEDVEDMPSVQPEPFINKPCVSEQACHEDKIKVLDKIRSEIKEVQTYKIFVGEDTVYVERNDVLAIIDRHMKESEEKE